MSPRIRVMVRPGDQTGYDAARNAQWCVACGDVPRPARRCHWLAVGFYGSKAEAETAYSYLNRREGRAIFDMSNQQLVLVMYDGAILRCLADRARMLS